MEDVAAWRRRERERLIGARAAMPASARRAASAAIAKLLAAHFTPEGLVGGYWPFRGEFDCRPLLRLIVARGGEVALPVVTGPRQPLAFHRWTPAMRMTEGLHGIPHPAEGPPVQPAVLLIPLVGFDENGHRLGYGAGYYDRTLAAMVRRPTTWGIGFELGRLHTVRPQPHDIALDYIVTEAGLTRARDV